MTKSLKILSSFRNYIQVLGYGVSHFFNILIPVLVLPVLTRTLSVSDFGRYSIYVILTSFLLPTVSFNLSTYWLKEYKDDNRSDSIIRLRDYFVVALLDLAILSLLYITAGFIFPLEQYNLVFYSALTFAFNQSIISLIKTYYRGTEEILKFIAISLGYLCCVAIVIGCLYLFNSISLFNYLVFLNVLTFIFAFVVFFREIPINVIWSSLEITGVLTAIKFSGPLVLYSLVALVFTQNDKLLVLSKISVNDLAIYNAAAQLSFGVAALGVVLQLAWTPIVFKSFNSYAINRNRMNKLERYLALGSVLLTAFAAFYYIVYPYFFNQFYPSEYSEGLNYYYFFILGGLFQSLYWLLNPFFIVSNKQSWLLYLSLVSAICGFALNFFLVNYGVFYAALGYMLSWFIQLLSIIIFSNLIFRRYINYV